MEKLYILIIKEYDDSVVSNFKELDCCSDELCKVSSYIHYTKEDAMWFADEDCEWTKGNIDIELHCINIPAPYEMYESRQDFEAAILKRYNEIDTKSDIIYEFANEVTEKYDGYGNLRSRYYTMGYHGPHRFSDELFTRNFTFKVGDKVRIKPGYSVYDDKHIYHITQIPNNPIDEYHILNSDYGYFLLKEDYTGNPADEIWASSGILDDDLELVTE